MEWIYSASLPNKETSVLIKIKNPSSNQLMMGFLFTRVYKEDKIIDSFPLCEIQKERNRFRFIAFR